MSFEEIDFDSVDMEFYDRQSLIKDIKRSLMERHRETAKAMAPDGYAIVEFEANYTTATITYRSGEVSKLECLVRCSPYIPLHDVAPSQFAWELKQEIERNIEREPTGQAPENEWREVMSEYGNLCREFLGPDQCLGREVYEYEGVVREQWMRIVRRFEDVGWRDGYSWREYVCVLDPSGKIHQWCLYKSHRIKDCLKTLAEAEKAAKAKDEAPDEATYYRICALHSDSPSTLIDMRFEADAITQRFIRAGWAHKGMFNAVVVIVQDSDHNTYEWDLTDAADVKACLKALAAAEKAAKGVK